MQSILKSKIIKFIAEPLKKASRKITIVGSGNVGIAIAISLLGARITNEIVFLTRGSKRGMGEVLDLNHATNLLDHCKVSATTDAKNTANSSLCIITAGMKREKGMSRLDLLKGNVSIVKEQVQSLLAQSPDTIFLMVTNPVDVMTYLAWKVSGLPAHRVIGSGTTIDTFRLRSLIAENLGVSQQAINANVIGEHGKGMVPCISSAYMGQSHLAGIYPEFFKKTDPDKSYELKEKLLKAGDIVIGLKGATWWAIGLCTSHIAKCILNHTNDITPVTTNVNGFYGIQNDVFMSLPCALNTSGISKILKPALSDQELADFQESGKNLLKHQSEVDKILCV